MNLIEYFELHMSFRMPLMGGYITKAILVCGD